MGHATHTGKFWQNIKIFQQTGRGRLLLVRVDNAFEFFPLLKVGSSNRLEAKTKEEMQIGWKLKTKEEMRVSVRDGKYNITNAFGKMI